MSHGQKVAKNAVWLMAATIGQKAIAFLTFTIIANLVGRTVTGQYFFAVSITSIFVTLTDLGMTPVVIRAMAANQESGSAVLRLALRGKALFIPLGVLASLLYVLLTGQSAAVILSVAFACFVMSADALSILWYGTIRGLRQLRFEALGLFLGQVITMIVSLAAAYLHFGVNGLIFGLFCGSAWSVGWSITQARRLGVRPTVSDGWTGGRLFQEALPFALSGLFVKLYSYVDTLLIQQFHGSGQVGDYAVAYKVTYALQFIPLAFVAALYPGMSAAHAEKDKTALDEMFIGSMRLMLLVSVPIAAGLSAFAPQLIHTFYPKFTSSILPLSILAWVLIPIFLDFPVGSLLNATHRAGQKTTTMGLTAVINVTANLLLVPSLGPTGAAYSGLISFCALFLMGIWFVRKDIPRPGYHLTVLVRGLIAAALIWSAIHFYLVGRPLLVGAALAGIWSLIVLVIFQLIRKEDVRRVRGWFKRTPTV